MAKRRKIVAQENTGFGGMDLSVNPQRMAGNTARVDKNGDHRWPQSWKPRPGLARGSLAKQTGIVRDVKWFKDKSGVERIMYFVNSTGKLEGVAKPTPGWNPPPMNISGAGFTFNPVTALSVIDPFGVTLKWTNPTSAFWRGTKVLRRTDRYPQGPNDQDATTVYNGRLATATDSTIADGATGYYAVYAYSRTTWAAPALVSHAHLADPSARVFALTASALYYTLNDGVAWTTGGSGLPATTLASVVSDGHHVYVTRDNSGVEVYKSEDGGATFTQVTKPTTVASTGHKLVIGADHRLLLSHATAGGDVVAYSDDRGTTWTDSAVISANKVSKGLVYVSGNTAVAVCYGAGDGDPFTTHVSADNGATWGASVGGTGDSLWVDLAVMANGNLVVSSDDNAASVAIYISTNTGTTWSTASSPSIQLGSRIAAGAAAGINFSDAAGVVSYKRSVNSGAAWGITVTPGQLRAAAYCNGAWWAGYTTAIYRGTVVTSLSAVTALTAGNVLCLEGTS